jgi:uncharacterized Rossmann fold enzyme
MDNLRFAPKGAKPAKGSSDKRRCREQAKEALADARWRMDISAADCDADAEKWERMAEDLASLMFAAYGRNHTLSER